MIDSHSHSKFSHDGRVSIEKLIARAEEMGMNYYAVTEHLDRDYKFAKRERFIRQLNLKRYLRKVEKIRAQRDGNEKTYVAFGVEAGYCPKSAPIYENELKDLELDVVINSIHTIDGGDVYFKDWFNGKEQDYIYNRYLDLIIESLDVNYHYDIVAHIGYVTRYAPYENVSLMQDKYLEKIDIILKKIIEKDKTIEINTHIKDEKLGFLPEIPLLKRYYELGGRNITFSSDTHRLDTMGFRYDRVVKVAKEIGFTHFVTYRKHQKVIEEF